MGRSGWSPIYEVNRFHLVVHGFVHKQYYWYYHYYYVLPPLGSTFAHSMLAWRVSYYPTTWSTKCRLDESWIIPKKQRSALLCRSTFWAFRVPVMTKHSAFRQATGQLRGLVLRDDWVRSNVGQNQLQMLTSPKKRWGYLSKKGPPRFTRGLWKYAHDLGCFTAEGPLFQPGELESSEPFAAFLFWHWFWAWALPTTCGSGLSEWKERPFWHGSIESWRMTCSGNQLNLFNATQESIWLSGPDRCTLAHSENGASIGFHVGSCKMPSHWPFCPTKVSYKMVYWLGTITIRTRHTKSIPYMLYNYTVETYWIYTL